MAVSNLGTGGGGFQVSPGINVSEIDLTTVVPAVSTTAGAIAGVFRWGPVDKILLIDSENTLAQRFGKPTNFNFETWFTAASFLSYGNQLYVSRAANTTDVLSAVANSGSVATIENHAVKNEDDYLTKEDSFDANVHFIAKYPGELGNSLKISVCDSANQYQSTIDIAGNDSNTSFIDANTKISITVGSNTANVVFANNIAVTDDTPLEYANTVAGLFGVGDVIEFGNSSIGKQYLKVSSVGSVVVQNTAGTNTGGAYFTVNFDSIFKLSSNYSSNTVVRNWEYFNQVDTAPGTSDFVSAQGNTSAVDEVHVVVVDEGGKFTGNPGLVLEVFQSLSRATDSKASDGGTNYFKTVVNDLSSYVWVASDRSGAVSNTALNIASSSETEPLTLRFAEGTDGDDESAVAFGDVARAYDKFQSGESVDVSLILTGKSRGGTNGEQLGNYLIDNIAEYRRDCVVFVSPERADVVNNLIDPAEDVVTFRNSLRSTSYAVLDSGYKYMYDKYNDVYRFVPLNGDIAGLCVNTDSTRDPWFSPAGFNRGNVKNVIKLAFNPNKSHRDLLYKNGVNPVVTFPGQGTVLFGDKTLLSRPSAFDRINVRRLFIVLEKAIANASQSTLFEFNDEFTRAQFKNMIEPFLRDVQGRRGIYDYRVVCDDTNNTGEVIDSNRFVGDIYIKPAKSINFIQLNFVAVRSSVEFSEVVNAF